MSARTTGRREGRTRTMGPLGRLLGRLRIDGFILAILLAVVVASVLPARGDAAATLDVAVTAAIALLFFLYGGRMHPQEALRGLRHWRLHAMILAFTFVAFPLVGIALRVLEPALLTHELYLGVLFMTLVPSTVQSSIAFTSIARGNVAGAIVSASASNLLGVFLTPALVLLLMPAAGGVSADAGAVVDIMLQLFVPFVLGQLSRPLLAGWLSRFAEATKYVDRGAIVLVVYVAFSAGVREGIWGKVSVVHVAVLCALSVLLVAAMLRLTRVAATKAGFDRGDVIAIQFCGTKKSLATGLPMAAVLFAGMDVGAIILPLMIFHQIQLMICAWLSARYARAADREAAAENGARPPHGERTT